MYGEANIYAQGADSIDIEGMNPKKAPKKAAKSKSPTKEIKSAKKIVSRSPSKVKNPNTIIDPSKSKNIVSTSPSTVKNPDKIIDPSKSKKSRSLSKSKKTLLSASTDKSEKTKKTDKSDKTEKTEKTESTIKTQKSVSTNKKLAKKIPIQYNFTITDENEKSKPTEMVYNSAIAPGDLDPAPWLAPTNLAQENLDKTEELIIPENDANEKQILPRKKKPKSKKKKKVVRDDEEM